MMQLNYFKRIYGRDLPWLVDVLETNESIISPRPGHNLCGDLLWGLEITTKFSGYRGSSHFPFVPPPHPLDGSWAEQKCPPAGNCFSTTLMCGQELKR